MLAKTNCVHVCVCVWKRKSVCCAIVYLKLPLEAISIDDEDINAHIVTQTLRNLIRSLYVQISAKLLIMSLYSLRGDSLSFALYLRPCEVAGDDGLVNR